MSGAFEFAIRSSKHNRRAVVFIHGYSGDAHSTFGMLPAFLAGDLNLTAWDVHCFGYATSLSPDITGVWSADPPLAELSAYFAEVLTRRFAARYDELALVAHSMGGLIVQRALLDGSFVDRIRHVLLFGTPSGGLDKARLGRLFKRQVRDMAPTSVFMQSLRADWKARFEEPTFSFDVVAGLSDQFVAPQSSHEPFQEKFRRRVPGNHLEMVKPSTLEHASVDLLLSRLKGRAATIPAMSSLMTGDPSDIVNRALVLDSVGREAEAIALLRRHAGQCTDVQGTLAGRLKRRWLAAPELSLREGIEAAELYHDGFQRARAANAHDQAFYNGINAAFMILALNDDRPGARSIAAQVLFHARAARGTKWAIATEAEAHLHLGETARALELYRKALLELQLNPRERGSMFQQAVWTARLLEDPTMEAQLEGLLVAGAA